MDAIKRKPNVLVLGYINGDEGASMAQCYYTLYYLLHGAVNMKPDIVALMKKVRFSFLCALNAERLQSISLTFATDTLHAYKKNMRSEGSCSVASRGVNLKYNFLTDKIENACSENYRGPQARSEPEIKALFKYMADSTSNVKSVVVISK